MSEFIDQVFTKTSPKRSVSVIQNERFGLVFAKTGSIISGTGEILKSGPTGKARISVSYAAYAQQLSQFDTFTYCSSRQVGLQIGRKREACLKG